MPKYYHEEEAAKAKQLAVERGDPTRQKGSKRSKVRSSSRPRKSSGRRKSSKDDEEAEFEEEDDVNQSGVRQFFDEEAKEVDDYDESEDEETGSMNDFIVNDNVVEYNSSAEESSSDEEPSRRSKSDLKRRKRILDDDEDEDDDDKQPTEHLMEAVERDEQELEEAKYFIDNSSIDNHEPVNHHDTSLVARIDHGRSSLDCRRRSRKRQERQEALADVRERRIQQMNCKNENSLNTNSYNVFGSNNLINNGTINVYTAPQPNQSSNEASQMQQVTSQVVASLVPTASTQSPSSSSRVGQSGYTNNIITRQREDRENVWMRKMLRDCLEELERRAEADRSGITNRWRNNFIKYYHITRDNGLSIGDRCHNYDDTVNDWVRRVSDIKKFMSYSDVERALLLKLGFYPAV